MKKQILIISLLVVSLGFSSCKKDEDLKPEIEPITFINLDLDGVHKEYHYNDYHCNTGGGYTGSAYFNFDLLIDIGIHMPQDEIDGSDLKDLIGDKIPIGSCGGCPTNMSFSYQVDGDDYEAYDMNNPFPDNYFKITDVNYAGTAPIWGGKWYLVSGEFNLKLSSGGDIKEVTNGKFRMLFIESEN